MIHESWFEIALMAYTIHVHLCYKVIT